MDGWFRSRGQGKNFQQNKPVLCDTVSGRMTGCCLLFFFRHDVMFDLNAWCHGTDGTAASVLSLAGGNRIPVPAKTGSGVSDCFIWIVSDLGLWNRLK